MSNSVLWLLSCYMPPTRALLQQGRWNATWSPAPSARRIGAARNGEHSLHKYYNVLLAHMTGINREETECQYFVLPEAVQGQTDGD